VASPAQLLAVDGCLPWMVATLRFVMVGTDATTGRSPTEAYITFRRRLLVKDAFPRQRQGEAVDIALKGAGLLIAFHYFITRLSLTP
jgi:hypothetical protein